MTPDSKWQNRANHSHDFRQWSDKLFDQQVETSYLNKNPRQQGTLWRTRCLHHDILRPLYPFENKINQEMLTIEL